MAKMSDEPSHDEMEAIRKKIALNEKKSASTPEFLDVLDRVETEVFFANPPEKFLARINTRLLECELIEANTANGYLVYLVKHDEQKNLINIVYIFEKSSEFQQNMIRQTFGEANSWDLRIVPIHSTRFLNDLDEGSRRRGQKTEFSMLPFHTYFGVPYYPIIRTMDEINSLITPEESPEFESDPSRVQEKINTLRGLTSSREEDREAIYKPTNEENLRLTIDRLRMSSPADFRSYIQRLEEQNEWEAEG